MKKIISIVVLSLSCQIITLASESLIWNKNNGKIIGHSSKKIETNGKKIKCGRYSLSGINTNIIGIGTVAVWVPGATNTNQLESITVIKFEDQEVDYDNWTRKERAMLKLIVKEINTLRGLHGLPARTKQQIMNALKNEID